MRIKETKVYPFNELSDAAKDKAVERFYDINVAHDWFDCTYEDAKTIGIKITGFDIDRGAYCKGEIITSAPQVIEEIIKNHGERCETYKTAKRYEKTFKELEALRDAEDDTFEDKFEDAEREFLQDLCEDYRILLQTDYEYMTSREAIIEAIQANEYEFTEDGKLA